MPAVTAQDVILTPVFVNSLTCLSSRLWTFVICTSEDKKDACSDPISEYEGRERIDEWITILATKEVNLAYANQKSLEHTTWS